MHVDIRNGRVHDVQLRIYEPPRFFEAFLRGRRFSEPVDITARICGICPVAYQMSACTAIEDACGVSVDGPLRELRRLLYCGEWIESHVLHIYMLHAPDFLGYESALTMASDHRARVEAGLDLKRAGNDIVDLIGGRAIHPINVKLGGFYRAPTRAQLAPLAERLRHALDVARDTVRWVAGFTFPDSRHELEMASLCHETEYPMMGGRLRSTHGLDIEAKAFLEHVTETQVPHSTALHARIDERGTYVVGPMARYVLNHHLLAPEAREAADAAGLDPSERNPFRSIIIRAIEVVHAVAEALRIIEQYRAPEVPAVSVIPRRGVGFGWTEAPRGMLWHTYALADDGTITAADIVPPTSQNQRAIEWDLRQYVERHLHLDDRELGLRCERVIRNYDPCISCATHFLDFTVTRS